MAYASAKVRSPHCPPAGSLIPRHVSHFTVCCNDVMTLQDLAADIEAIKQLKYRYLRAMDTKHWDDFAETMTEDISATYGHRWVMSCTSTTVPIWSST